MECADSRHVTLCDADSRGFIVVAFCSAILHHWMCKIPTEVATLTHQLLQASFTFTESMQLNQPALFFDQKRAQKEALRAVLSCEGTTL
ncbi:hypothetical protein Psal006b_01842 [Piscirickettsia salmonis]|uniref:Transposase n=1 Tax=Piscirickettsia salmonis TaxID=1238 RepID=A0A1L6TB63_PISSA|nr:transposase [Piscirickettsia salmonis]ALT18345.1 hypothetical protein PSLF89_05480 [Piscirickettsia salmonis LF-89 = ATCC VR-1361]ALY02575.1 hypothetical protein AWE47_06710 [Piscirickettsia salmonis]AMA42117.1 hypothetical protein AWJ11_06860 [Piscirickettsia salmonis]AOS34593.1 hypothetical protein AVM72_04030 [Piscirickettsia salmonis]